MVNGTDATPRERGWRRLLPAIALFLFVPAVPYFRAVVTIEQTLVLMVPALAVCAWLAWRAGGRLWLALAWTAAALVMLTRPMAGEASYVALARGWALVLAAVFGGVGILGGVRPFFGRALATVAVSGTGFMLILAVAGATPVRVERVVANELDDRVESSMAAARAETETPRWQEIEKSSPDAAKWLSDAITDMETAVRQMALAGTTFFPAILLFESIAALGLAWSLHHRLSSTRIGPPLAPLREFRFDDQLVWGAVAGLTLALIPRFVALKAIGLNLVWFFGVLYALRGLGVMAWFLIAPGQWSGAALIALFALLWPLPLSIGLADTWFDWRRRVRPSSEGVPK